MQGLILINKPSGFTSFDVVAKLRGITKQKRIGHTGTLDPMATGVLPCLFGTATKLAEKLPSDDKEYIATLQLGVTTDTLDITGTITSTTLSFVTREAFEEVLSFFNGEITQTPPMYSAISLNGRRLYDMAREGIVVERPTRQVVIHYCNLISFDELNQQATIKVGCGKGTYIRSIAEEIGDKLAVGACLKELIRTKSNGFDLCDCLTLEQMQELCDNNTLESAIIDESCVFSNLPKLNIGEWHKKMLNNGVPLMVEKFSTKVPGVYSFWNDGQFFGIYEIPDTLDFIKTIYKR